MRKVCIKIEIGFAGCDHEVELDVHDDITEKELNQIAEEEAAEWAEGWIGDERLYSAEEWEDEEENFRHSAEGRWEWVNEGD